MSFGSRATSLVVSALCLVAMSGGVSLLRLSLAETGAAPAEAFRPLVGDPFVGSAAALDLAVAERSADPALRARDLGTLLVRAPLTAGAWLDLAVARRAAGESLARVVEALRLSALTGPREARLMSGRVAFALPFWFALPQDLKDRLIGDLAGVAPYLEERERRGIAALVGLQAREDVEQICAGLRARGAAFQGLGCEAR